jgi:hypothetical protein
MLRQILLALAWLMAMGALYLALLGLELYWNLPEWRPRSDATSVGLVLGVVLFSSSFWFLTRARSDSLVRWISAAVCLTLVLLGLYVCPPEPPGHGLFERAAPSPAWYRAGRFIVMSLPGALWLLGWRRAPKKGPGSSPKALAPKESGGNG